MLSKMCGSCSASIMKDKRRYIFFSFLLFVLIFFFMQCGQEPEKSPEAEKKDSLVYLNHSDSARYVGMNTCRQCHQSIYNTFIQTGMGQSFDIATRKKSSGNFSKASVYDHIADFHYSAYWNKDSLYIKEYRLNKKDTVHSRTEQ